MSTPSVQPTGDHPGTNWIRFPWYGANAATKWEPNIPVLIRRRLDDGTLHYTVENFFQPEKWLGSPCNFAKLHPPRN